MTLKTQIETTAANAKDASFELMQLSTAEKNKILKAFAKGLLENETKILKANEIDLKNAKKNNLTKAMQDRLMLNSKAIKAMAQMCLDVAKLPDPVGKLLSTYEKENGVVIKKVRVPIGVIAVIYESRPNVTVDVAVLCLKSGNTVILRGGREALATNKALYASLMDSAKDTALPKNAITLITETDRIAVKYLAQSDKSIDCIIPRGGEKLIQAVMKVATVPVIKHHKGVCHLYIHEKADLTMALKIAENAKCQRPSACNAIEKILIDEKIASKFLPMLAQHMSEKKVEIRGDEKSRKIVPELLKAKESDWEAEYLDLILAVRVVKNLEEAIAQINHHGSHHSDAIITENKKAQELFLAGIDSAIVYVNASTRFTDGGEFGMGAEIGISTEKLHARGPMGLEELCSYKYLVTGSGQVRD